MAKQTAEKDRIAKVQRRLAKARLRLEVAQAKQAQVRQQGKQEIEKVRLLVAERVAEAGLRVQSRRDKVARAEAQLLSEGVDSAEAAEDQDRLGMNEASATGGGTTRDSARKRKRKATG